MWKKQLFLVLLLCVLLQATFGEAGRGRGNGRGRGKNRHKTTTTTTTSMPDIIEDFDDDSSINIDTDNNKFIDNDNFDSFSMKENKNDDGDNGTPSKDIFDETEIQGNTKIELKSTGHKCEPIRIEVCRNIGYNVTLFPNMVGHEVQMEADLQLQTFMPLVQYGCSSQLRFFLCSVYSPMCTEKVNVLIGPCRPLCESVQARCGPILQELGFRWPAALNCSRFVPENTVDAMCMEGPKLEESELKTHPGIRRGGQIRPNGPSGKVPEELIQPEVYHNANNLKELYQDDARCARYRQSDKYRFLSSPKPRCVPRCDVDILYTSNNKETTESWALFCALLLLTTTITALILLSTNKRAPWHYPERAVLYMCGCYIIYGCAYVYRAFIGHSVSACVEDQDTRYRLLAQDGETNPHCLLIFIMLYYFSMAAQFWWMSLAVGIASNIAFQWRADHIAKYQRYWQIISWVAPGVLTFICIVLRAVEADELTGMCFVGGQTTRHLLVYVLLPFTFQLGVGSFLIVGGYVYQRWWQYRLNGGCGKGDSQHINEQAQLNVAQNCLEEMPERQTTMCFGMNRAQFAGVNTEQETGLTNPVLEHTIGHHQVNNQLSAAPEVTASLLHSKHDQVGHLQAAYQHDKTQAIDRVLVFPNADESEVVLMRSKLFALIYFIPALIVWITYVFEYLNRDKWIYIDTSIINDPIQNTTTIAVPIMSTPHKLYGPSFNEVKVVALASQPSFDVFNIRFFMLISMGIACSIWIIITRYPKKMCAKLVDRVLNFNKDSSDVTKNVSSVPAEVVQPMMANVNAQHMVTYQANVPVVGGIGNMPAAQMESHFNQSSYSSLSGGVICPTNPPPSLMTTSIGRESQIMPTQQPRSFMSQQMRAREPYNLTPSDLHFLMNPSPYYPAAAGLPTQQPPPPPFINPHQQPQQQHCRVLLPTNTLATTTTNSTDVSNNTSSSGRRQHHVIVKRHYRQPRHGNETEV